MLLVGTIRNNDGFVCGLVLHQLTLTLFENTNHLVGHAVDKNRFAERLVVGIESFGNVRADHGDIGVVKILGFVEEAAALRVGIENLFR